MKLALLPWHDDCWSKCDDASRVSCRERRWPLTKMRRNQATVVLWERSENRCWAIAQTTEEMSLTLKRRSLIEMPCDELILTVERSVSVGARMTTTKKREALTMTRENHLVLSKMITDRDETIGLSRARGERSWILTRCDLDERGENRRSQSNRFTIQSLLRLKLTSRSRMTVFFSHPLLIARKTSANQISSLSFTYIYVWAMAASILLFALLRRSDQPILFLSFPARICSASIDLYLAERLRPLLKRMIGLAESTFRGKRCLSGLFKSGASCQCQRCFCAGRISCECQTREKNI